MTWAKFAPGSLTLLSGATHWSQGRDYTTPLSENSVTVWCATTPGHTPLTLGYHILSHIFRSKVKGTGTGGPSGMFQWRRRKAVDATLRTITWTLVILINLIYTKCQTATVDWGLGSVREKGSEISIRKKADRRVDQRRTVMHVVPLTKVSSPPRCRRNNYIKAGRRGLLVSLPLVATV